MGVEINNMSQMMLGCSYLVNNVYFPRSKLVCYVTTDTAFSAFFCQDSTVNYTLWLEKFMGNSRIVH